MAGLDNCSVGEAISDDANCHKSTFIKGNSGVKHLSEFSDADRKLILWRSGNISCTNDWTICLHHEYCLLQGYDFLQRHCCDPLKRHKRAVRSSLRAVSEATAKQIGLDIKPGQKLCIKCRCALSSNPELEHIEEEHIEDEENDAEAEVELDDSINMSIQGIGCSPFMLSRVSSRDKVPYVKRKVTDATGRLAEKAAKLVNVNPDILSPSKADDKPCKDCDDLENMMAKLKVKFKQSSRKQKLQILTLVPDSWTVQRAAEEFATTKHMVKEGRRLKTDRGILSLPDEKRGKVLPEIIKQAVVDFFSDDQFSRCCPGQKDFVTVRTDGQKVQHQKRLLLANLKELYLEFVKQHPALKIGFSTFCALRPPWCITVSASGSHSVCVCQSHQNVKLLLAAVPSKDDYKHFLSKLVCDINSRECMIHRCHYCPGTEGLRDYTVQLFDENGIGEDELVVFKQWRHTDRTSLDTLQESRDAFIELLCTQLDTLSAHHFISKAQASYLKECKNQLQPDECIILGDFAENYSFIVQDAVQGHHWDNSQATLHPFVCYFRPANEALQSINLCVISDCMNHSTSTVHKFQDEILKTVKGRIPGLAKVIYFSDGCAAQYKNYKNFANLIHHEADFKLKAEWHFFATSHGKSPCDGIGGTIKRLAARASLQATLSNQILTPYDLYCFGKSTIKAIIFHWISREDVEEHIQSMSLDERYSKSSKVAGTRSYHSFIPVNNYQISVRRVLSDISGTLATVLPVPDNAYLSTAALVEPPTSINDQLLQPGQYVSAVYDKDWYIGVIVARSDENEDILVKFMARRSMKLSWPRHDDICWVPFDHVLSIIPAPEVLSRGARQYELDHNSFQSNKQLFERYEQMHF